MSCLMLSSHLYLGLPCDLLVRGFQLNVYLTVLVSDFLCTWPNQLSLWAFIQLIIFLCFINLCSSSLVLILCLMLLGVWFQFPVSYTQNFDYYNKPTYCICNCWLFLITNRHWLVINHWKKAFHVPHSLNIHVRIFHSSYNSPPFVWHSQYTALLYASSKR
jgi:hypothetical protein